MNRLDKTDTIDYAWGVIDTVAPEEHSRPLYWGFGFEGMLGLISGPSIVYEDGEVKYLPPRDRPEIFRFKSGDQSPSVIFLMVSPCAVPSRSSPV